MALHKSWNIRDQTEDELRNILEKKYKEINANEHKGIYSLYKVEEVQMYFTEKE